MNNKKVKLIVRIVCLALAIAMVASIAYLGIYTLLMG